MSSRLVERDQPRGLLWGGPRDGDVVPLDGFFSRIAFPRYRDDGQLADDVYEFNGCHLGTLTPRPYRYVGERERPYLEPVPEPPAASWRERVRFLLHGRS